MLGEESWAKIKGRFWDLLSFFISGEVSLLLEEREKGNGMAAEAICDGIKL